MSETDRARGAGDADGWSFEATERRQLLRGLELTPLERLRWLDRAKEELASLLGRASSGSSPRR